MILVAGFMEIFDQSVSQNLNHLAFLLFLVGLLFLGMSQFRKRGFPEGLAIIFVPFTYIMFAFFYFFGKAIQGRSDQYVDWRNNWMFGISDIPPLLVSAVIPVALFYLYLKFIQWCARRAETANRSKKGFMLLAIVFPLIAWIILLIIAPAKQPST